MDAHDVERLLREDAARYDEQLAEIDLETWKRQVLDRLGLNPTREDPTDEPAPPR